MSEIAIFHQLRSGSSSPRWQVLREMHYEVIVKHYACALFHKAISACNAASIRNVATLHIEPLGGIVPRMQSDSDAYNTRTAGCFTFCAVK